MCRAYVFYQYSAEVWEPFPRTSAVVDIQNVIEMCCDTLKSFTSLSITPDHFITALSSSRRLENLNLELRDAIDSKTFQRLSKIRCSRSFMLYSNSARERSDMLIPWISSFGTSLRSLILHVRSTMIIAYLSASL